MYTEDCLKKGMQLNSRYVVQEVLDQDKFEITYAAVDWWSENKVIIKELFLKTSSVFMGRRENDSETEIIYPDSAEAGLEFIRWKISFLEDAQKYKSLNDKVPELIKVKEFFQENGTAYVVTEYLEGTSLRDLFPMADVEKLFSPILKAFEKLHRCGTIFLNRNLPVDSLGYDIILADLQNSIKLGWCLAGNKKREYFAGFEYMGEPISSCYYYPLEGYSSRTEIGPWTDIYCLCAFIYYCVTGYKPAEAFIRVSDGSDFLQPPSALGCSISPHAEQALMKGLALRPEDRYQNIRDFCRDFYGEDNPRNPFYEEYHEKKTCQASELSDNSWGVALPEGMRLAEPWEYLSGDAKLNDRYVIKQAVIPNGFMNRYIGWDDLGRRNVFIKEFYPTSVGVKATRIKFVRSSPNGLKREELVEAESEKEKTVFNELKEAFLQGGRLCRRIARQVPELVETLDIFEENGTAYIVEEYLEGREFTEVVDRYTTMETTMESIQKIFVPVFRALEKIHRQGVSYHDLDLGGLAPWNIVVTEKDGLKFRLNYLPPVIMRTEGALVTARSTTYSPGEVYRRANVTLRPWTDIYSVCAMIYPCVTGIKVEDGNTESGLKKPSQLQCYIPENVEYALMKGLEVEPEDRYLSIRDFCRDFYRGWENVLPEEKNRRSDGEDMRSLSPGTRLNNRYVIRKRIGSGGFGITYAADDELFEEKVALKEYFPQRTAYRANSTRVNTDAPGEFNEGKQHFFQEAKVMSKFSRIPGMVRITNYFEANETGYIAMEYLDGFTLKEYMEFRWKIPMREMLGLIRPVVKTLAQIHAQGLIHRDISPDNIMLLKNGDIKLMDFGAARDYTGFGKKSLTVILKRAYAPVEQFQSHGMQGPWTDIFALSATIYRCIAGQIPEDALDRISGEKITRPSFYGADISEAAERVLMKGLALLPKDRYQSLDEFCSDLYGSYGEPVPRTGKVY